MGVPITLPLRYIALLANGPHMGSCEDLAMATPSIEQVGVFLGTHKHADQTLFGPFPGRRLGDVIAYEMQAPANFTPWPGRSRVERKYALLDLGVSFGIPCWSRWNRQDGTTVSIPVEQKDNWYVDLVTVDRDQQGSYVLRDMFIDVMISDGKVPRMLDLDEIADAREVGWISTAQLIDGLRRWQRFLDRHVHVSRFPQSGLSDFPPAAIRPLAEVRGFFASPVTWPE